MTDWDLEGFAKFWQDIEYAEAMKLKAFCFYPPCECGSGVCDECNPGWDNGHVAAEIITTMIAEGILTKTEKTAKGEQLYNLTDKFSKMLKANLLIFSWKYQEETALSALTGAITLSVIAFAAPITTKGVHQRVDIILTLVRLFVEQKKE